MTDLTEEIITSADFTGPTDDAGGSQYEQYISADTPDHDPFADYPEPQGNAPVSVFVVPMAVSAKLAHNLDVRRQKIWACWGGGVVVGWIGDAIHQHECTDHNRDSAGVVHAIDPMVTGAKAKAVVDEALAHPQDLQYVIHNRVVWSATVGWKPRKYTGSNPHTDHVHLSGKHGSANYSTATCTGYDLAAAARTPTFDICPAPKPHPAPRPPVKPSTHAPGSRVLKYREGVTPMSGDDVTFVQRFIGKKQAGPADGRFGPQTARGVRWYRRMRSLRPVGEVDALTWKQMGVKWHG